MSGGDWGWRERREERGEHLVKLLPVAQCTLKENYALISLPVVTQFSIIANSGTQGLKDSQDSPDLTRVLWHQAKDIKLLLLLPFDHSGSVVSFGMPESPTK